MAENKYTTKSDIEKQSVIERLASSRRVMVTVGSIAALMVTLDVMLVFRNHANAQMRVSTAGVRTIRIFEPDVKQRITEYRHIRFQPGDRITVIASGCAQTGGSGRTWKRYVNPIAPDAPHLYHGLLGIPGATDPFPRSPTVPELVRIKSTIGREIVIPEDYPDPAQLFLRLGYEDRQRNYPRYYRDNGYSGEDDGTENQCVDREHAVVILEVRHGVPPMPPATPSDFARQRGCRTGGLGGINMTDPHYVSVESENPATAEGFVRTSIVSHEDLPSDHTSHDWNFFVKLDRPYNNLNSSENRVSNDEMVMEMEWETRYFPNMFLPIAGDRVWMMGRWIFDCGHLPYHTEFHPPLATAFTRRDPTVLAGDRAPSFTNKSFIYIHGEGGYYRAPVAVRDYQLSIRVPPRPSRTAELRAEVVRLPFGGPAPILTPSSIDGRVHVVYPLAAINDPSPARQFGAIVAAGWREPILSRGYRRLRVTFDAVRINTDHDPFASGEWRFWVRAGSEWFEVPGLDDVDDGDVMPINRSIEVLVPEDGAFTIQTTGWEDDCDNRFATPGHIRKPELGDLQCVIDPGERLGIVSREYRADSNFGIGAHAELSARHPSREADDDTRGDFTLLYRITQLTTYPAGTPVQ
jgi:hypothetical protein